MFNIHVTNNFSIDDNKITHLSTVVFQKPQNIAYHVARVRNPLFIRIQARNQQGMDFRGHWLESQSSHIYLLFLLLLFLIFPVSFLLFILLI